MQRKNSKSKILFSEFFQNPSSTIFKNKKDEKRIFKNHERNFFMNKKIEEEKRNIRIVSYLNQEEMDYFKIQMKLLGLNQTELIRWSLFNREINFDVAGAEKNEERKQIIYELGKIGNNLNQIAHHLNGGGEINGNVLSGINENINFLHDTMMKIYKEDSKKRTGIQTKFG